MTVNNSDLQHKLTAMPKRALAWSTTPVGVVFYVCIVLSLTSLLAAYHIRAFTSDDVVWQNALLSWRPFHNATYISDGTASYIAKVPIYWILLHIFSPGRHLLLATAALFSVGNFVLFYWSALYFLKKWGVALNWQNLVPFMWLSSFGFGLTTLYLAINLHNIEIGIMFAFITLTAKIYHQEFRPFSSRKNVILSVIGTGLLGTMIVSDHYFFYFLIIPIVLFTVYAWLRDTITHRLVIELLVLLAMSAAWSKVVEKLAIASGITLLTGVNGIFVTTQTIGSGIEVATQGLFTMFGGDIWGREVSALPTDITLVNAAALVAVIALVLHLVKRRLVKVRGETIFLGPDFFSALFIFTFALYVVSGLAVDDSTYRYFIMLPFIAALLLPIALARLGNRARLGLTILLIASALCSLFGSIAGVKNPAYAGEPYPNPNLNRANSQNIAVAQTLETLGLQKGYSGYWDANITSYLSGGKATVLQTTCGAEGTTNKFYWLVNTATFSKPASRSFYVYDPAGVSEGFTCTMPQMAAQFGQPQREILVGSDTILVYNYDITSNMPNIAEPQ